MEYLLSRIMSAEDAKDWKARISACANQLRLLLFEGYERRAWEALGHTTWTDCLQALAEEYRFSERRLWQLHAANQIEQHLTEPGSVGEIPERQLRPLTGLAPDEQREVWTLAQETAPHGDVTAAHVQAVVDEHQREAVAEPDYQPTFNRQTNESIGWAKWTWNPVTGCLHDCDYCYARDIAMRWYPEKFEPTFHPERLHAPHITKLPAAAHDLTLSDDARLGWRNVFTCSMADLFGRWVPQEWIDAVLAEVRAAPQWNFLFLTKFPQRLASIDWPPNAWVGTTVDRQYRVKIAEKAFREVNATFKWLSCEPLLEDLQFESLSMFDWVVIGGQSKSTRTPEFHPPWAWVEHLYSQARQVGCRVFWKENLTARCQEYPRAELT